MVRRWHWFWHRQRLLLVVALGLIALDWTAGAFEDHWRRYDPDDYADRVAGCQRTAPELVLVGGSPVSEGLDPGYLVGLAGPAGRVERVYNLGLPGGTTSEVWHAVKHGLVQPPAILIYGITASDLNDSRQEPHGPAALMDLGDVADWIVTKPGSAEWVVRQYVESHFWNWSNLFRYRRGIRLWVAEAVEEWFPGTCSDSAGEARREREMADQLARPDGFAPRPFIHERTLPELRAANALPPFLFLKDYRLGEHAAYLDRMLDWAAEAGVFMILLDMPVSEQLDEREQPEVFARYRRWLAGLERAGRTTVLRADRRSVGLDDADFADQIHLNARGCARLSSWLRATLSATASQWRDRR